MYLKDKIKYNTVDFSIENTIIIVIILFFTAATFTGQKFKIDCKIYSTYSKIQLLQNGKRVNNLNIFCILETSFIFCLSSGLSTSYEIQQIRVSPVCQWIIQIPSIVWANIDKSFLATLLLKS